MVVHCAGALEWVVDKEAKTLEVLHGQSDLSSWFFIESGVRRVTAARGALLLNGWRTANQC